MAHRFAARPESSSRKVFRALAISSQASKGQVNLSAMEATFCSLRAEVLSRVAVAMTCRSLSSRCWSRSVVIIITIPTAPCHSIDGVRCGIRRRFGQRRSFRDPLHERFWDNFMLANRSLVMSRRGLRAVFSRNHGFSCSGFRFFRTLCNLSVCSCRFPGLALWY